MISFYNSSYTYLAVYTETEPDMTAVLTLKSVAGDVSKRCKRRECTVFTLAQNVSYTLKEKDGEIVFAYLFSDHPEEGISFPSDDEKKEYSFHFSPKHLPIKTPAALFWRDGLYHLLYTASPFKEGGEASFICHAVSCDLTQWKQSPVLFEPHEELHKTRHRFGGAYGGSIREKDGIYTLYFTRRIGEQKTGKTLFSYVTKAESRDMYHFSPEEPVIQRAPIGFGADIRDAFVFLEGDTPYMLVCGEKGERGAILLYKETEGEWKYIAPLLKSKEAKRIDFPSIYKDGKCSVAICTLSASRNSNGNSAWWFSGNFKDEKFTVRTRGKADFGGDFYGPRILQKEGRTLLFGTSEMCGNGALLMPRELTRKKGKLFGKPFREIYSLLGETIYEGKEKKISMPVPSAYYLNISFSGPASFSVTLSQTEEETVCFIGDEADCGYKITKQDGLITFLSAGMPCNALELFFDGGIIEAFVNGGEAVGTKMIKNWKSVFTAEFKEGEGAERLHIRKISAS